MNCQIPDNSPRVESVPQEVSCRLCGTKYFLRVFPLHAQCPMGEVQEFLEEHTPPTVGLGDVIEKVIATVTLGLLKGTEHCGCNQRKQWLNEWWSWRSRQ